MNTLAAVIERAIALLLLLLIDPEIEVGKEMAAALTQETSTVNVLGTEGVLDQKTDIGLAHDRRRGTDTVRPARSHPLAVAAASTSMEIAMVPVRGQAPVRRVVVAAMARVAATEVGAAMVVGAATVVEAMAEVATGAAEAATRVATEVGVTVVAGE